MFTLGRILILAATVSRAAPGRADGSAASQPTPAAAVSSAAPEPAGGSAASQPTLTRPSLLREEASLYRLTWLNHFLFLVPPLAWNVAFTSRLPMTAFPGRASTGYLVAENIARGLMLAYPLLLPIDTHHDGFVPGAVVYGAGLALYFSSWAYLMARPGTRDLALALAPAYTPAIWLTGMAMMSRSKLYYVLSAVFIALHVGEFVWRSRR
jgi:hypothetical protein